VNAGMRHEATGNSKKATIFAVALCAILFAVCQSAEAQQPKKVPRIVYLAVSHASANAGRLEAFRQGLRDIGYVEGENIVIEDRYADGKFDRLPALAAELVRLKVDVIITAGPPVTRAVKEATATIPVVMAQDGDPVGNGFVASLARPGGNITGMSQLAPEISGKQLELLNETVLNLARVAVLGTSTRPGNAQALKETELAAGTFGLRLQYLDVRGPKDIETAFREARKGRAGAVLVLQGPSSRLSEHRLLTSRQKPGYLQFTHRRNIRRPAASCPMALTLPTCSVARPTTWTGFLKARSLPIFLWSKQRNSS
jgi:ABC-type uncharacterized transport system substrate-binding protein